MNLCASCRVDQLDKCALQGCRFIERAHLFRRGVSVHGGAQGFLLPGHRRGESIFIICDFFCMAHCGSQISFFLRRHKDDTLRDFLSRKVLNHHALLYLLRLIQQLFQRGLVRGNGCSGGTGGGFRTFIVGNGYGDGLADLLVRQHKGLSLCAGNYSFSGLPLIGQRAGGVGIGHSGKGLPHIGLALNGGLFHRDGGGNGNRDGLAGQFGIGGFDADLVGPGIH